MAIPLQRDQGGSIRYAANVCWRDPASNLADNVIAGALRSLECDIDLFQRLLGDAALQDIELETYRGIQLQVRTMRIERFPLMGAPIRLDWRSAWTTSQWEAFIDAVEEMTAGDAKSALQAKIAKIEACFAGGEDDPAPPFSITYPDCDGNRVAIDPEELALLNSESGDCIAMASPNGCGCGYNWPLISWTPATYANGWGRWGFHDVPVNRYVEVKYLVGFATAESLRETEPSTVANIAALFNYRFENPEIMGGQSSKTYELLMMHFQKHLKWRV